MYQKSITHFGNVYLPGKTSLTYLRNTHVRFSQKKFIKSFTAFDGNRNLNTTN